MKINNNSPLSDAARAAGTGARTERSATATLTPVATTAGNASGVPVSMSAAARALGTLPAGAGIDTVKVAAMREAIADGSFRVDAEAIADKLLSNAQEFLSRSSG